jgi:transposase
LEGRRVEAAFDGGLVTSDAGALLLGATDRAIRMMDRFASCFHDERRPEYIEHEVATLVGQRVFGIARGYEDLNDHDELRHDPMMAILAGKLAARREDCAPVAGKSTLNRLELSKLSPTRYHKISHNPTAIKNLLVKLFVEAHERARQIILDLDATDDPLHGEQEGRFFHAYYDCYCYLPVRTARSRSDAARAGRYRDLAGDRDAEDDGQHNRTADRPADERSKRRISRGALPTHLPRVHVTIEPDSKLCPCCHGQMHVIGEDSSQRLNRIPAQYQVIVTHRPKYGCRACESAVVQAPAPERLIKNGIPTERLVASVVTDKYAWHNPLYRQAQIMRLQGLPVDRSTLAQWVGAAAAELQPLHDHLVDRLKASPRLFCDETRCPVLDPGAGKTKTGYMWAVARDDRPWGGADPPAVAYSYAPGRGGEHAVAHRSIFRRLLPFFYGDEPHLQGNHRRSGAGRLWRPGSRWTP